MVVDDDGGKQTLNGQEMVKVKASEGEGYLDLFSLSLLDPKASNSLRGFQGSLQLYLKDKTRTPEGQESYNLMSGRNFKAEALPSKGELMRYRLSGDLATTNTKRLDAYTFSGELSYMPKTKVALPKVP